MIVKKDKIRISVNITAHNEGLLLYKTLRNIQKCIEVAEDGGVKGIEINISLDRADSITIDIANTSAKKMQHVNIFEVSFGDLGDSRNYLIGKSKGEYIVFFDGDDLFTEDYLLLAYKTAKKNTKPAVYSPEYLVSFDGNDYITKKYDCFDSKFKSINLFEFNYFISQSFVHHEIYKTFKYRPNQSGYGIEDWDWNMRVLHAGFKFINVPESIFFYRRKKYSLLNSQVASKATLRDNPFFQPEYFSNLPGYKQQIEYRFQADENTHIILNSKKYLKLLARIMSLGTETGYNYLQEQYEANKRLVNGLSVIAKNTTTRFMKKSNPQLHEGQQKQKEPSAPKVFAELGVPVNVIQKWKDMNKYEPMIRASKALLQNFPVFEYATESLVSLKYHEFCSKYKMKQFDDLVVVPHIVRGGADLAIIKLVESLARQSSNDILIFSTLEVESPWSSHVTKHKNVTFIEMRSFLEGLDQEQRLIFLLRIIQNWNVKRFNIVNSGMGYDLLMDYGDVVNTYVKTYLHTYAYDMDEEGYLWNWIKNGLVNTYPYVKKFITDSSNYKKQLIEINGFKGDKIEPLFLPVNPRIMPKKDSKIKRKILWAGRISDAKLIDVAVEVANILSKEGIDLDFYGSIDPEYRKDDKFIKMIKGIKSIKYKGSFEGYDTLPVDEYDIFLLTSKNEGMPNVVLESLFANLFVVAPRVGGISEVVNHGTNGYLVSNNLTSDEYVKWIKEYYRNKTLHNLDKRSKYNKKIQNRHSQLHYDEQVQKLFKL